MGADGACAVPQLRQALVKAAATMAFCAKGQLRVCTIFPRSITDERIKRFCWKKLLAESHHEI